MVFLRLVIKTLDADEFAREFGSNSFTKTLDDIMRQKKTIKKLRVFWGNPAIAFLWEHFLISDELRAFKDDVNAPLRKVMVKYCDKNDLELLRRVFD